LKALCCLNQVNKRFNNITCDYQLYTSLNVRNVCHINPTYLCNIFRYFTHRCKYLNQLDLTASEFFVYDFVKFLDNCGKHLTHLRLSKCQSVNNVVLMKISKLCKNLKSMYIFNNYICIYVNIKIIISKLHMYVQYNTFF